MTTALNRRKRQRVLSGAVAAAAAATAFTLGTAPAEAASGCTTLYDGHSGNSHVCKTWNATGGGYYKGSWSIGVTTSYTYVQLYKDGSVSNASGSRGSYSHVKHFYLRACSSFGGCGGWW